MCSEEDGTQNPKAKRPKTLTAPNIHPLSREALPRGAEPPATHSADSGQGPMFGPRTGQPRTKSKFSTVKLFRASWIGFLLSFTSGSKCLEDFGFRVFREFRV